MQNLPSGTASGAVLLQYYALYDSSDKSLEIDTGMLLETDILCRNESLYQIRGQLVKIHPYAVVLSTCKCTERNPIGRYYLGCKLVNRILKILNRRSIPYPALAQAAKNQVNCKDSDHKQQP